MTTLNNMRLWYTPHNSVHRPMKVPVLVAVTAKWLAKPGITSRLNSNGTIQNAWTTSIEVRLNFTVSPVGISSRGRFLSFAGSAGFHIAPVSVTTDGAPVAPGTLYCGYWNCQLHWKPVTFTTTCGCFGSLSM